MLLETLMNCYQNYQNLFICSFEHRYNEMLAFHYIYFCMYLFSRDLVRLRANQSECILRRRVPYIQIQIDKYESLQNIKMIFKLKLKNCKFLRSKLENSSLKKFGYLCIFILFISAKKSWKYKMDNLNSSSTTNCPIFLFKCRHPFGHVQHLNTILKLFWADL